MLLRTVLFLLFAYNLSIAQLSVRNDYYVFVNDQIVFVEDDVNLNESDSRIYLRNEAQIIQGSGTTGNSGVGELSVYQEGNVGEYEYNYWCSPIGSKTSNFTNNPFGVTFLNEVTGIITCNPATITNVAGFNSTSSPLTIEQYWIWKFIASDEYSEWIHVEGTTTLNPGEGFTMKGTIGSGDAQQYDFRGKPNNGTIAVSVLNNQFTLVGNPYPSAMDALAYIHDTDNVSTITGTLHYWEQDPTVNSHFLNAYDGGYATYTINAAGTLETYTPAIFSTYNGDGTINGVGSGSPSGKQPRRYIPIGQGFMVEGIANGVVQAKNSHRVYEKETSINSEFFKTQNKKNKSGQTNNGFSIVPEDYKRFRLNVDFNNHYSRQLVETFHPSASLGFDHGLESKINKNDILTSDAYLSNNNNTYLAEALAFDEALKIPLTINLVENMPLRIRIADIQNFDTNQPIFIHDIETDVFVNLKNQDFNTNLEAGNYTNRFEITFTKTTLNIADNNFVDFRVIQNNSTSELKVINPSNLSIKHISLYDVSGKKVITNNNLNSTKTTYTYSTQSLSSGTYVVKIESSNGENYNKKIIINN